MLFNIAWKSLLHRKVTVLLTLFSIAVSVMIVLSIEHIRTQTKQSFTSTLSGTDLIVGARAGRINLLLYSVFRIGNATNNISWESYQKIRQQKGVSWTIPISLGDSHNGYRVLGTNEDYFKHYRYSNKQLLEFKQGEPFNKVYDAVIGSEVARKLNYTLGQAITLSHGIADVSFTEHKDKPFRVVGILNATGTPVDQTVHISLAGLEAVHIDWKNGAPHAQTISAEDALKMDLSPKSITAFLLGLDNRIMTFRLQRAINTYKGEALMAVLPGIALTELWQTMSLAERVLSLVAALVVISSLLGLITIMLSTLQQRQQEISVLRSIGASPWFIFLLIEIEVLLVTLGGIIVGLGLLFIALFIAQPFITDYYGLFIDINPLTLSSVLYCGAIIGIAALLAFIPATMAYRQSRGRHLTTKS